MPKRQKKFFSLLTKPYFVVGALFLAIATVVAVSTRLAAPVDIDYIATEGETVTRVLSSGAASGCYYQDVQCFKAPCEPILVCPDGASPLPSKEPEVCTQEAGACIGYKGECVTYTNGCIKSRICAKPYQACRPTSTPTPIPGCTKDLFTCPDGSRVGRTGTDCAFVCPTPTATPISSCVPRPSCLDADPRCLIKAVEGTTYCPPSSPTPTPSSVKISFFQAANPCGEAHFYNYQVTCYNGVEKDLSAGRCLPLSIALSNAAVTCQ